MKKSFYSMSVLATCLVLSQVNADDKIQKNQTIIDDIHTQTVIVLNESAEVLPEFAQEKAKSFAQDVNSDGKNISVELSIKAMEYTPMVNNHNLNVFKSESRNIVLGSLGVIILPNTWAIKLGYSGTIYQNESEAEAFRQRNIFNTINGQFYPSNVYDDGEEKTHLFDLYFKPIRTLYGNIGLGYKHFTSSYEIYPNYYYENSNYNALNVLDKLDPYGNILQIRSYPYQVAFVDIFKKTFTISYDLPNQFIYIPDGLGFKVSQEKTNEPVMVGAKQMILKPNTTSMVYGIGITKSFDELNNGFNFKSLLINKVISSHKYFDYSTNQNSSKDTSAHEYVIEPAYVWKYGTNKKISLSFNWTERKFDNYDNVNSEEVSMQLGLIY